MPRKKDYVPRGIDAFYVFAQVLVAAVVASGAGWGLSVAVITAFQNQFNDYETAYNAQTNKNKRTREQVDAHLVARKLFEGQLRNFVSEYLINNSAISHSVKIGMGLNPREDSNRPRPAIETVPIVIALPRQGCELQLECRVEADQSRPSIQADADGVEIRYIVDTVPATWKAATQVHFSSRARFKLEFEPEDEGKQVYVFARWKNNSDDAKSSVFSGRISAKLIG